MILSRENLCIIMCLHFILRFHIYVLTQILSWTQNWSSNLNYTCHWAVPFSHSIPFLISVVERTCPECYMMENIVGFGIIVSLQVVLFVIWTLYFGIGVDLAQMGQCSPHPHISSALPWRGLFTIAQRMASILGGIFSSAFLVLMAVGTSVGGIGQDALASNKFVEAGMVLGHGVSFLFCRAVAVTAVSGCCSSWELWQMGVEGPSISWSFLVGQVIPLNLPWAKLYTVTGIDVAVMAADFATGIWVVAIAVTTFGVGSLGKLGFMDNFGLVGIGCAITLTLNLLFTGTLALFFFSTFLGTRVFHGEEFLLGKKVMVCGCGWGRVPSVPFNSKHVLNFLIRDW